LALLAGVPILAPYCSNCYRILVFFTAKKWVESLGGIANPGVWH